MLTIKRGDCEFRFNCVPLLEWCSPQTSTLGVPGEGPAAAPQATAPQAAPPPPPPETCAAAAVERPRVGRQLNFNMEASDQGAVGAIVDAPAAVVAPTAAAPAGDSAPVRSSGRKKPVGAPAAAAAVNTEEVLVPRSDEFTNKRKPGGQKGPRGPYKKGKLQNGNTNIDLTVVHNKQEKKLASADELGAIAKLEAKNQGKYSIPLLPANQ